MSRKSFGVGLLALVLGVSCADEHDCPDEDPEARMQQSTLTAEEVSSVIAEFGPTYAEVACADFCLWSDDVIEPDAGDWDPQYSTEDCAHSGDENGVEVSCRIVVAPICM